MSIKDRPNIDYRKMKTIHEKSTNPGGISVNLCLSVWLPLTLHVLQDRRSGGVIFKRDCVGLFVQDDFRRQ